MDPDVVLEELRELYNEFVQDEGVDRLKSSQVEAAVVEILTLFDDLDNWLISGGFLPKEWRR